MQFFYFILLVFVTHNCNSLIHEDTDLNSLSNYETVEDENENSENWESDDTSVLIIDNVSDSTLEEICKNVKRFVYIKQEDVMIDCNDFQNNEDKTERIVKRDVDEFEGSGDPEPEIKQTENETTTNTPENTEEKQEKAPENTEENQQKAPEETEKKPETTEKSEEKDVITTTEGSEPEKPEVVPKKPEEPEKPETTTEKIPETSPEAPQPSPEAPKEEEPQEKQNDKWEADPKKQVEKIAGKTILGPNKQETKFEKAEGDESVKAGESSKESQKAGSKDTTILVGLFVAVLVVGALAFGYNFIKKRKQRSADLERVERAPSIKRSLQNLTKPEEPEKKPLMNNQKEVEMVDMKKVEKSDSENSVM